MMYLAFRFDEYWNLRRKLLRDRYLQREFLEVTRDSASFIAWIEDRVGTEERIVQEKGEASESPPPQYGFGEGGWKFGWLDELTEKEYKNPPELVERALFSKWRGLSPAQASEETFWGYVTLEHIRKGIIEASWLAAYGGDRPGGLERIDRALEEGQKEGEQEKRMDSAVRTILRCFSGLRVARGYRSVYVDCPFARAWWRRYWVEKICNTTGADCERVAKTLAYSSKLDYWEALVTLIISAEQNTGDNKISTALQWALSERVTDEKKEVLFSRETLIKIRRLIGIRLAWQELGVFEVEELKGIMDREFLSRFV